MSAELGKYSSYPRYKKSEMEWNDTLPLSWNQTHLRWIQG